MNPQLFMLAGPNGAGKTTLYEEFLGSLPLPFLNAYLFEAQTGMTCLEAARMLDAIRNDLIEQRVGFITETVFSDVMGIKLALLRKAIDAGYDVLLYFIGIEPQLSELRIAQRVASGGHDVPRDRLAGRFERSIANLREAITFVPLVKIYDNSSIDDPYRRIAVFESGRRTFLARAAPAWAKRVLKSR